MSVKVVESLPLTSKEFNQSGTYFILCNKRCDKTWYEEHLETHEGEKYVNAEEKKEKRNNNRHKLLQWNDEEEMNEEEEESKVMKLMRETVGKERK